MSSVEDMCRELIQLQETKRMISERIDEIKDRLGQKFGKQPVVVDGWKVQKKIYRGIKYDQFLLKEQILDYPNYLTAEYSRVNKAAWANTLPEHVIGFVTKYTKPMITVKMYNE